MGLMWKNTAMNVLLNQFNKALKRVLIIDDEMDARSVLKKYLADYCPRHDVVGEASGVEEAFRLIREVQPDLLFLDIEMGDGTGFDLLDRFPSLNFHVVFTTAFDDFALKAFKYSAVDYLLKPIAPEDFIQAIDRASQKQIQNLGHLMQMVQAPEPKKVFEKIALPSQEGLTLMDLKDIVRLQSDGGYTTFWDNSGEQCLVSRTIGEYEELLPDGQFLRVHSSHLINLDCVKKFLREDGGFALMADGSKVPVARRRKEQFVELLRRRSIF